MSHPHATARSRRYWVLLAVLVLLATVYLVQRSDPPADTLTPERAAELGVAHLPEGKTEIVSDYSRIRIVDSGTVRSLLFVRDDGSTATESEMDLARPQALLVPYTRAMFASYLFLPRHQRVLIIGLGGGSMVRFLEHHEPQVEVDAVEIDPVIVEVARDYFGTHASPKVRIFEEDGFEFLRATTAPYDVIYMDAFLKPSEDTDDSGTPLRLKSRAFLQDLRTKVHGKGLIVFNVNELTDIALLREVFPQVYVFRLDGPGVVAVGSGSGQRATREELLGVGRDLDDRFQASFSFAEIAARLAPEFWPVFKDPAATGADG